MLDQIYKKIDNYLLLEDKSVIKLLAAFVISSKLPTPPPWLFLVSGSSAGKTELLTLLEKIPGYYPVDDLTNNALLSGMKRHDESASLLHRLPPGSFLVFSDFTVMLEKHKDELAAVISKLRVVYDGKASRMTGGLESEIKWQGKVSLLAACTTSLYTRTEDYAQMGQRMLIYQLGQANDYDIGRFIFRHSNQDAKAIRSELQDLMLAYTNSIPTPEKYEDLPQFDEQTEQDILDIAHLTVSARSPVTRQKFHRDRPIEMREAKESIGRIMKQLMTLAYGLMLQNPDHKLTNEDRSILYKIGLDCIDPRRRQVLQALTKYSAGGDLDRIADLIGYPRDSANRFVDDLLTLGLLQRDRIYLGHGSKYNYRIKDNFGEIMQRFEAIETVNTELPPSEEELASMPEEISAEM